MKLGVHLAVVLTTSVAVPSIVHAESDTMTYEQAYREALQNSELVMLAERDRETFEIELGATWSDVRPTISAQGDANLQRPLENNGITFIQPYQLLVAVNARQPVFRKGFFSNRDAARHAVAGAAALVGRERERVARDVAIAMTDVLRTRALIEIAKGAVARAKAQVEFAVARVKAGNALKTAEMLSQIDLKRAEVQVVTAQRDAGIAEAAFRRLVGRAPPPVLVLPLPAIPATATVSAVVRDRRDLHALELSVLETDDRIEVAEGRRWWPQIDVNGQVRAYSPEVQTRGYDWRVVGTITIPLLQSGREAADVAQAKNAAHAARLTFDRQKRLLAEEIEAAAVQVAAATLGAELAELQLKVAQDHYQLVDKQFKLGAITYLEVTNAQAALSEAERSYVVASMDRVRAIYEYLFVVGKLDPSAVTDDADAAEAPASPLLPPAAKSSPPAGKRSK